MELIQFLLGLIFILLNEIIKFSRKKPIISLLFIFGLWVNSLPLPDEKSITLRQDSQSQIERTLPGQKALGISGGDDFTNPNPVIKNPVAEGASDRGPDRLENYDPSSRTPAGGSGSSSVSLSETKLDENKVTKKEDWDINEWLEEDGATISKNLENQIYSQLR